MTSDTYGVATEMQNVGDKEGFKIYSTNRLGECSDKLPEFSEDTEDFWAQDMWMIINKKLLTSKFNKVSAAIKKSFNLSYDNAQYNIFEKIKNLSSEKSHNDFEKKYHIAGGNVFIVKGKYGDELLIGQDELETFNICQVKSMFGCGKVTVLPQMDFHLDLFIRPLDNRKILLSDDKKTLEILQQGLRKVINYTTTHPESRDEYLKIIDRFINIQASFETSIDINNYAKADDVAHVLKKKGFDVIRVPGRLYTASNYFDDGRSEISYFCNYMNANVLRNKDNELVYITNKSMIDEMLGLTPEISKEIGFSFEKAFLDSISHYVKNEHVYFIEGKDDFVKKEMLYCYQGGIHCATTEIPE
uniref:Uncharacterized protein n=1 Tax=uncultured Candidatus Melainabacteria bacterium TaxID=2682970 RepID=A0A650EJB9_9BACT|nr:hypothetical protein Melaina855_0130 [uncultured Candidatus Melainabacteria bacterium]